MLLSPSRLLSLQLSSFLFFFFFTHPPPTEIYTLSLHDALPISLFEGELARRGEILEAVGRCRTHVRQLLLRSEEHTSELQSRGHLVCRLLLEKKKNNQHIDCYHHTANLSDAYSLLSFCSPVAVS